MNWAKHAVSRRTNPRNVTGGLNEAVEGADVFIGFSTGGILKPEMVSKMADDAIVLAFATPEPEIGYKEAKAAGARIVAVSTTKGPTPQRTGYLHVVSGYLSGRIGCKRQGHQSRNEDERS